MPDIYPYLAPSLLDRKPRPALGLQLGKVAQNENKSIFLNKSIFEDASRILMKRTVNLSFPFFLKL